MVDSQTLRSRVLTILGAGVLFTGAACGGTNEVVGGVSGAGGRSATGAAGSAVKPGTSGAFSGGGAEGTPIARGGTAGTGSGTSGTGGEAGIPACQALTLCYTPEELKPRGSSTAEGGAAGALPTAGDDAGMFNVAGAAGDGSASVCPVLDPGMPLLPDFLVGVSVVTGMPVPKTPDVVDYELSGPCCYQALDCHHGRPFTVDGATRTAPSRANAEWSMTLDTTQGFDADLDPATRAALAAAWLEDALAEHASIASFARLTLELMQHGAPAELVAESQRASLDEVEHARACFALAERYSGVARGPGDFPLDAGLGPVDLAELASRTVHEGCVGETLAALIAAEQALAATDPSVRAVLEKIAEDEAHHAEFAWRVVRWALEVGGPAVRATVALAFAQTTPNFSHGTETDCCPRGALAAHGQLTNAERTAVVARGLRDVVAPCARALLLADPGNARQTPQLSAQI